MTVLTRTPADKARTFVGGHGIVTNTSYYDLYRLYYYNSYLTKLTTIAHVDGKTVCAITNANKSSCELSLGGLIPRTLGASTDFTLLSGRICLHGVLD